MADKNEGFVEYVVHNQNIDIGSLLLEDCKSYEGMTDEQILKSTQNNICEIYKNLFDLKKKQRIEEGEQGEILEYTRSKYSVVLPKSKVALPRHKTIPKQKPLTKWEKFRLEKGLPSKAKRSRYVYDPVTKDWLPRYGMGSIKKV